MKAFQTPSDIANTAIMLRTTHKGAILVAEGDTDLRLIGRFIDNRACKLIPAFGKPNALGALGILERKGIPDVLAVVDADHCHLDGVRPASKNIFFTDSHDLDTMMLTSQALEAVLQEFALAPKIARLGSPIREVLIDAAYDLGLLRWLASPAKDKLPMKFKGLEFERFIDTLTLKARCGDLINEVRANSNGGLPTPDEINKRLVALRATGPHDPWQVCSGHDLNAILAIGLRHIFGKASMRNVSNEAVESMMRLAYDSAEFNATRLFAALKLWEAGRPSGKVLKS